MSSSMTAKPMTSAAPLVYLNRTKNQCHGLVHNDGDKGIGCDVIQRGQGAPAKASSTGVEPTTPNATNCP